MSKKLVVKPHFYDTGGCDPKKMIYTMMTSGVFKYCECSVMNKEPKEYDAEFFFPKDLYVGEAITDENIGSYSDFIKKVGKDPECILQCTCALDESDIERATFMSIGDTGGGINFTTLDNSKHDLERIFASLMKKYKEAAWL